MSGAGNGGRGCRRVSGNLAILKMIMIVHRCRYGVVQNFYVGFAFGFRNKDALEKVALELWSKSRKPFRFLAVL